MNSTQPTVSVLMPVYNAEKYLSKSIESILNQTFEDFEFLIFNDGSVDKTKEIIESYSDNRIRFFDNTENKGYLVHLNTGIEEARGKYIARIDADDIALPNRLKKQVEFLERNSEFAIVGSQIQVIDESGNNIEKKGKKILPEELKIRLFYKNDFIHSSITGRTEVFRKYLYNQHFYTAEDYFLWSQISKQHKVAIFPEVLVLYRHHDESITIQRKEFQDNQVKKIHVGNLRSLGIENPTSEELDIHFKIMNFQVEINPYYKEILPYLEWIDRLQKANNKTKAYPVSLFNKMLSKHWQIFFDLRYSYLHGKRMIKYLASPLNKKISPKDKMIFKLRCLKDLPIVGAGIRLGLKFCS